MKRCLLIFMVATLGCSGGPSSSVRPSDAGPLPTDATNGDAGKDVPAAPIDAEMSDASPGGDFFGSIVWQVGIPDGFGISAVFAVGVRSVASKICENGTLAGSCCFTSLGGAAPSNRSPAPTGHTGPATGGACPRFDLGDSPDLNPDVGVLSFTSNGQPTGSGLRDPETGYRYRPLDGAGPRWQAGDRLGASGPGGPCAPSFAGSIKAVGPLDVSVPQLPFAIQVDQGFALQWTPDPSADSVHISIASLAGIVDCTVSDSAGQVVVPAAVTRLLGASPTAISIVHLWRANQTQFSPNLFLSSQYDVVIPAQLH